MSGHTLRSVKMAKGWCLRSGSGERKAGLLGYRTLIKALVFCITWCSRGRLGCVSTRGRGSSQSVWPMRCCRVSRSVWPVLCSRISIRSGPEVSPAHVCVPFVRQDGVPQSLAAKCVANVPLGLSPCPSPHKGVFKALPRCVSHWLPSPSNTCVSHTPPPWTCQHAQQCGY